MRRRTALHTALATGVAAASAAAQDPAADPSDENLANVEEFSTQVSRPVFIATWPFGLPACQHAAKQFQSGGSILDAVEKGINVTELDAAVTSVGLGGYPNAQGVVQLDASFMDGHRQRAGAVAALEGFANPISVARRVMESTRHVMLAGRDAARFAKDQGFEPRDLLTEQSREAWRTWQSENASSPGTVPADSHDTIALLGVTPTDHLAGGCSTSGLAFKLPGRVGDGPLIGSGLYVDGRIGAAGATGVGENILRYCGSFLIVEAMRQGLSPTDACVAAIRRIADGEQKPPGELSVNFVALNRQGVVGAAGTDEEFRCAAVDAQRGQLLRPLLVR